MTAQVERGSARDGVQGIYPLTPMQHGMLVHTLQDDRAYVEQFACTIEGALDVARFERAFQAVIDRHDVLRTSFAWRRAERPMQVVNATATLHVVRSDSDDVDGLLEEERRRGLDLTRAPVMRVVVASPTERRHHVVWTHHHMLLDGWSVAIVLGEVLVLYDRLGAGAALTLPRVRPFKDYVTWLAQHHAATADAATAFWRDRLHDVDGPTSLLDVMEAGVPGPIVQHHARLSADLTASLTQLARREGVTVGTVVQSAWAIVLAAHTRRSDVVFGATSSGRPPELEGALGMVGLFINTLPVRVRLDATTTLTSLLRTMQRDATDARPFEWTSLVDVQSAAGAPSAGALFEGILVHESYPSAPADTSLSIASVRGAERTSYPWMLVVAPGNELSLRLDVDPSRLSTEAARALVDRLAVVLRAMSTAAPEVTAMSLAATFPRSELIGPDSAERTTTGSFVASVVARALAHPDRVAVVCGASELTYGELVSRAGRLASILAIEPRDRVGVAMSRSVDLPVVLLGILLAGAAYVPLGTDQPAARASAMARRAGVRLVVTDRASHGWAAALTGTGNGVVVLEDLATDGRDVHRGGALVSAESRAYVIFTSGSTGAPKGVAVSVGHVTNLLASMVRAVEVDERDVWLAVTPLSFDIAGLELWAPLTRGATVVIAATEETKSGRALAARITTSRATVLQATPSTYRMLLEEGVSLSGLRRIAGGEALSPALAAQLLAHDGPLWNAYGPTETTIWSTLHRVSNEDTKASGHVAIGKPLARTTTFIVDGNGETVPVGVAGELWIGGAGVAEGYFGDEPRTREAFVDGPRGRRYRTGDRVRQRADGVLVWLGRGDGQLKIRGHRVEIGEIEAALERMDGVSEAAVITEDDGAGGPVLVAFIAGGSGDLRERLRSMVPEVMVPSRFERVTTLPRTPHGKVDRRALAALARGREVQEPSGTGLLESPRTPTEEVLAAIFADILGIAAVAPEQDFFDLGGHSLLATRIAARVRRALAVELPVKAFFEAPTVRALARAVDALRGSETAPPRPAFGVLPRPPRLPLSFAQARLWLIDQLEPGRAFYNLPLAVTLRGPLDERALQRAFDGMVVRHESLRTTFHAEAGVPFQVVGDSAPVVIATHDLRGATNAREEARRLAREVVQRPFDLTRDPMLRVMLLRLDEEEHVVVVTMHHIAADGWSLAIFVRELVALYGAADLPPLLAQVPDFAVWQRDWLGDGSSVLAEQLAYFTKRLAGAPPLALPTDRPRPQRPRFRGARHAFRIDAQKTELLRNLARRTSATLFMTLLAGFEVLLARLGGVFDLSIGVPIANRAVPEAEPLIGFFANTLVLRTSFEPASKITDVIERVRETALAAYTRQELPFEQLVEHLNPSRDRSRTPLFQAMFVFQNTPQRDLEAAGLTFTPLEPEVETAKVDLELTMMEDSAGLAGSFEYDTDLYDASTITRMAERLALVLDAAIADPASRVEDITLRTADDARLEASWNATSRDYDLGGTVMSRIHTQMARAPEKVAVVHEGATLTYRELEDRVRRVAGALSARGVRPGTLVGVAAPRSFELVIAILGVLEAGAAHVPLDPEQPDARLRKMAAHVPFVLAHDRGCTIEFGAGREVLPVAIAMAAEPTARDTARAVNGGAAYVMFTSGSTGEPKGVVVEHRGLLNRLAWMHDDLALSSEDVFVHKTPYGFDVSVWELLSPFVLGARLVMARPGGHRDADYLADLFSRERVTTAHFVPSMLRAVVDAKADALGASHLRRIVCSGEALSPALLRAVATRWPALDVHNLYGPTEATIDVTTWSFVRGADISDLHDVPIGRPVANTRVRVLDERRRPVPIGVVGELALEGVQLARGYLGDEAQTHERFVADPDDPRGRLYLTGDLVRWRGDGQLLYEGRRDEQVKIRGVRVELGEVEAALETHPEIRASVVIATAASTELAAYVVPRRDGDDDRAVAHVNRWAGVFDATYRAPSDDPELHLGGWTRSSDGAPIAAHVMQTWIDETVARILRTAPRSVLELGCGTGLLAFRIAPQVERYVGIDIAVAAVDHVKGHAKARGLTNLEVHVGPADAAADEALGAFDAVVLSSVVQYFPSARYLEGVLAHAIARTRDGGSVFVGDVRNLALLGAFAAEVELHRAPDDALLTRVAASARGRVREEEELVLDPAFFAALARREDGAFARLGGVRIEAKRGPHDDEMTTFRYDVTLDVRAARESAADGAGDTRVMTWSEIGSLDRLDAIRAGSGLVVTGIPNVRVVGATHARDALFAVAAGDSRSAKDLRADVAAAVQAAGAGAGISPDALFERGARVMWDSAQLDGGALVAVFGDVPACALPANPGHATRALTNRPWEGDRLRTLGRRAREHARGLLPDVMVPRFVMVIDEVPLTKHGKIDRAALPPVVNSASTSDAALETEHERLVSSLFVELLGVDAAHADDSFFDLGGHSLLATQLVARIQGRTGRKLALRVVFEAGTVRRIAAVIDETSADANANANANANADADADAGAGATWPLSFAQRRMVVLDAVAPEGVYNVPVAVRIRGPLDREALRGALEKIVRRHGVLRTQVVDAEPEPVQSVGAPFVIDLGSVDLRAHDDRGEQERAAAQLVREEARRPLDLRSGRLLRAALIQLRDDEHVLTITVHHFASDRWSIAVLLREIIALYESDTATRRAALPPLALQYGAWAARQRADLSAQADGIAYWQRTLEGAPHVLTLASDRPRPPRRSFAGARHVFRIEPELTRRIEGLATHASGTPFMVFLAAFQALLHRAGAGDDLVVGTPVAGRTTSDTEALIGLFVNTLPLRARFERGMTFEAHLARVRESALDAFEHQHVPFESIVAAVAPERTAGYEPLVQVMLVVQNVGGPPLAARGLELELLPADTGTSKLDLTLFVEHAGDATACEIEYDTDRFDPETMKSFARAFVTLLDSATEDPSRTIETLSCLDRATRDVELAVGRGDDLPIPAGKITDLVWAAARKRPDTIALSCGAVNVTSGHMEQRTREFVTVLRSHGVTGGGRVAIAIERSIEAVIAILGVLEAGAAWVYVDPSHPEARRAAILADAAPRVVVTAVDGVLGVSPYDAAPERLRLTDEAMPPGAAYVLYTSGSSGEPKGVVVSHHALVSHTTWMQHVYPLDERDRVLLRTSLGFDASVWEVFAPLVAGARLVIMPDDRHPDPAALVALCERAAITVLQLVPTLLRAFLDAATTLPQSLRRVFAGGEELTEDLRESFYARARASRDESPELVNLYGPTEATIDATSYVCRDGERGPTPIGRPIANMRAYVLDAAGAQVPRGFIGELFLAGAGLASGYLGDATKTAERFVADTFVAGERMLATGDRVRRRSDGALVFQGRSDDQVKVGGVRVELGEIEAALRGHPAVAAAAVVWSKDLERLVAYVVVRDSVEDRALRAAVASRVVPAAIPAVYMRLPELPRLRSGKIDRRALPPPAPNHTESAPPRASSSESPAETTLAGIFRDVLRVARVEPHDDFFELGGDSIQSLHVVSRARRAGLTLTPRDVFEAPTVRLLADRASAAAARGPDTSDDAHQGPLPLTPIQRCFFDHTPLATVHHDNQSAMLQVHEAVDVPRLAAATGRVVAHHPMLRARFTRGDDGTWTQAIASPDASRDCFSRVDLTDVDDVHLAARVTAEAARVQASLDITRGPVFRVVLLDPGHARTSRILLVAHHLVVDAVSWAVVEEDLFAAYAGAVDLPRSTAFAAWAHATSTSAALPHPASPADAVASTARSIPVVLAPEVAARLTGTRARPADVLLLTALVRALATSPTGAAHEVDVAYESHGRGVTGVAARTSSTMDLSRTVGWFTILRPLSIAVRADLASQLDEVRAALAAPAVTTSTKALPAVVFNYLGKLDGLATYGGADAERAAITPAAESRGAERAADAPMPFTLDVTGGFRDGALTLTITYSAAVHGDEAMASLARRFDAELRAVAGVTVPASEPDARDYPEADLTQRELARVLAAASRRGRR